MGAFGSLLWFCSVRTAHHQSSRPAQEVIQPSSATAGAKQPCCVGDLLPSLVASPWLRAEMMFSFFLTMPFLFPFTRSFPKWQIRSQLQMSLTIQPTARLWDLKGSGVVVIQECVYRACPDLGCGAKRSLLTKGADYLRAVWSCLQHGRS